MLYWSLGFLVVAAAAGSYHCPPGTTSCASSLDHLRPPPPPEQGFPRAPNSERVTTCRVCSLGFQPFPCTSGYKQFCPQLSALFHSFCIRHPRAVVWPALRPLQPG